jgi:UPF0755 protein
MSDRNGYDDGTGHQRRRHPAVDRGHQVIRDSQGGSAYPPPPFGADPGYTPNFIEHGFDGIEEPRQRRDQTAGRRPIRPAPASEPYPATPYSADPYAADQYAADPYAADPYAADQTGARRPSPDASRLAAGRRAARTARGPEPRPARGADPRARGYADDPAYGGPGYGAPGQQPPGYDAPGYEAPGYAAGGYEAPGYGNPAYENTGYPNQAYENTGGYDNTGYPAGPAYAGYDNGYGTPGYDNPGYDNATGYDNTGGYDNPAYDNTGGYDNTGYDTRGRSAGVYGGGNGYDGFDEVVDAVGAETPRRRGRSALTLAMVIILFAAVAGVGFVGYKYYENHFTTPDYSGTGTGSTLVIINSGDTATTIGDTLTKDGVIKSTKAFIAAATANPQSQKIQAGAYRLHKQMSAVNALNALLAVDSNGKLVNLDTNAVTIPEGEISVQIYALLSKKTGVSVADFQAAAKDPEALGVPSWWFANGAGAKSAAKIEGFLYPDTYAFQPGSTAKQILSKMVGEFNTVTNGLNFRTRAAANHVTPYQELIAASIAQEEAIYPQDMAILSRILYNRVQKPFPCSCFQVDSSINYWLKLHNKPGQASKSIGAAKADASDPYNTYLHAGWPPGPIGNPGKSALTGAETAPANGYFFWVTSDTKGHMYYAKTYSQHQTNIRKACANGVTDLAC